VEVLERAGIAAPELVARIETAAEAYADDDRPECRHAEPSTS
jgi:hypothetical protein